MKTIKFTPAEKIAIYECIFELTKNSTHHGVRNFERYCSSEISVVTYTHSFYFEKREDGNFNIRVFASVKFCEGISCIGVDRKAFLLYLKVLNTLVENYEG